MFEIITAIYENGVLRPLNPLKVPEKSTVRLQVLPEDSGTEAEQSLQSLVAAGMVTPPPRRDDIESVSEEARRELAERLGQRPGKPLSEIIIEERGPW